MKVCLHCGAKVHSEVSRCTDCGRAGFAAVDELPTGHVFPEPTEGPVPTSQVLAACLGVALGSGAAFATFYALAVHYDTAGHVPGEFGVVVGVGAIVGTTVYEVTLAIGRLIARLRTRKAAP